MSNKKAGRRVWPDENGVIKFAPGDYGIDPRDGRWYARPPDPKVHLGCLENHDVTEHDDGTITVSPSILITDNAPVSPIHWHGFLKEGVWEGE